MKLPSLRISPKFKVLLFVLICTRFSVGFNDNNLRAESENRNAVQKTVLGLFGSLTSFGASLNTTTPDYAANSAGINLSISLVQSQIPQIESIFSGPIIYKQSMGISTTTMLPRFTSSIAIGQDDGFIGIYQNSAANITVPASGWLEKGSKISIESENAGRAQNSWKIYVFDANRRSWVNPLLFNKVSFTDSDAPQILSLAFHEVQSSRAFIYDKRQKAPLQIKQGSYQLAMEILDRTQKVNSFSGVFSLKVLMDGATVFEKKLDTISASADGIAPFGNKPPSKNSFDADGRLILGVLKVLRGIHVVDITATDFAGNSASLQLRVLVE